MQRFAVIGIDYIAPGAQVPEIRGPDGQYLTFYTEPIIVDVGDLQARGVIVEMGDTLDVELANKITSRVTIPGYRVVELPWTTPVLAHAFWVVGVPYRLFTPPVPSDPNFVWKMVQIYLDAMLVFSELQCTISPRAEDMRALGLTDLNALIALIADVATKNPNSFQFLNDTYHRRGNRLFFLTEGGNMQDVIRALEPNAELWFSFH